MAPERGAILAIDLGTSSAKALIVGVDGAVLGRGQASYPTLHQREGHDEQRVDDWLDAIATAIAGARRFATGTSIEALAITGQMHGTVLIDRHRLALQAGVIWSDHRTASLVEPFRQRLGDDLPITIGGPLGTGYQALTLAWFRANRPQVWERIAHVLLPVDFVGFRLTGALATDPSNAVSTGLVNAETGAWDEGLLDAFGIPASWLPPVVATGTTIGNLTRTAAAMLDLDHGLPVIHGGGDAPAAAIGGHVRTSASAMITLSTGAQVMRPTGSYAPDRGGRWHTWPAARPPGSDIAPWLSVGALLNGGRAIDWIHRTLAPGLPIVDLMDLAHAAPVGSGGLLFLPYLAGERSPLLDPYARGAFVGLDDRHTPGYLVRAVLEGVALAITNTLDQMTPEAVRPSRVVFGGGGSSPVVRQIIASVLGVPLTVPSTQEVSAFGAATIAAHVLGWHDLASESPLNQQPTSEVIPTARDHQLYEELLAIFREATDAILPTMHRLQQDP